MSVYEAIVNVNTVLILLGTGLIIWIIRQAVPDEIEAKKVWRIILRFLPIAVGAGLALIPGIKPMENISQSVIIGAVTGSLSSSTYEIVRELMGEKIKVLMGSPQQRKRQSIVPSIRKGG